MCMDFKYSKHLLARANERSISLADIELLLTGKELSLSVPSKSDETVVLVLGFVSGNGIAVIVNNVTKVVITVRRMRKNEEKLFMEVIS